MNIRKHELFIDARSVPASSKSTIDVINPSTGLLVASAPDATTQDIETAVSSARTAFRGGWADSSNHRRCEILRNIARLIRERSEVLASMEVSEVGRPISEIRALDVPETADCFDFYASAIRVSRGHTIPTAGAYFDFTVFDPVGVVGQITPWNFPLNLASWKIAPALAMGNCVVVKPSEFTPSTTFELARIASEAGLPDGVLNVVTGYGSSAGRALVENPSTDMIAFTGSISTGRQIAEIAGRLGKRVSLELGGKSAQIVFADAEIEAVVPAILEGIFFAQGENCCAGSRLLVEKSLKSRLVDNITKAASGLRIGSPEDPSTQIGCLINEKHYSRVQAFLQEAEQKGYDVRTCGDLKGFEGRPFIAPTIVVNPPLSSRIVREEVFGPVLVVHEFTDEDEAVELASATEYDLAVGLWTESISRVHRMIRKLRFGSVWVNTFNRVFNDAPFGGFRWSGNGRDLGLEALAQYSNVKNVCIALDPGSDRWF